MKFIAEIEVLNERCKIGDIVKEQGTNKICILGKTGIDTGVSMLYNLDGSFYDTSDMFDKIRITMLKPTWFQKILL